MMLQVDRLNERIKNIEIPERMSGLPINERGFPVPWFVPTVNGKPDFRCMDGEKMGIAVRHKRCWMCGQPLGKHMTFAIGPMCMVNRNISEPPSHLACVEYGVKACPYLTQPKARRNEKDIPKGHIAGMGIMDNPGLTVLWTTLSYKAWKPHGGGILFEIGEPEHVEYYTEGRKATKDEVLGVMSERIPILIKEATKDGKDAVQEVYKRYSTATEIIHSSWR